MNQNSQHTVEFQIKGIEVLDLNIKAPRNSLKPNTSFHFEIKAEHRANIEKKIVLVICSVYIFSEDKKELFGNITTSCIYNLLNIEDFLNKETKSFALPKEFATNLNSMSISTTRGVMYSFFRGTFLHNVVLPVVDPRGFIIQKGQGSENTK